jgi:putative ABC transport system permease protein
MRQWLKLVARNTLRHRLRTSLTLAGVVVAIMAFGVLQTVVGAWYAGIDNSVASRLITRNAISFSLPLPSAYEKRIREIEGVRGVTYISWFGGVYKEPKNFFPQFAVDADTYFDLYPEILVSEQVRRDFLQDRRGAVVGRKLADRYGFKPGDVIQLSGTIFPGNWELVIKGIFDGLGPKADPSQLLFRWDYLNETLRLRSKTQADMVGFFVVDVVDINQVAEVSQAIDAAFRNSLAETRTETERAFQIGFVKQSEAIIVSIRLVSFVVIFIILAVMANTMALTVRERLAEYATLKAIGFGPRYVAGLILGESMMIAAVGGGIAIALTPPVAAHLGRLSDTLFPTLVVSGSTMATQAMSALVVGVLAAFFPMRHSAGVKIVEGLRAVG